MTPAEHAEALRAVVGILYHVDRDAITAAADFLDTLTAPAEHARNLIELSGTLNAIGLFEAENECIDAAEFLNSLTVEEEA